MSRINEPKPFDASFQVDLGELFKAVELLASHAPLGEAPDLAMLPAKLPTSGVDEKALLSDLSKLVLHGGFDLGGPVSFAHMDPPNAVADVGDDTLECAFEPKPASSSNFPKRADHRRARGFMVGALLRHVRRPHGSGIDNCKSDGTLGSERRSRRY